MPAPYKGLQATRGERRAFNFGKKREGKTKLPCEIHVEGDAMIKCAGISHSP